MFKNPVFSYEDLKRSWDKIKAKVDLATEIPLQETGIDEYLQEILEELNDGTYTPNPIRQYVCIRRPSNRGNTERKICILSVADRIVQQALVNLLNPLFEPEFLDCSYAYRRGRSSLMAAERVQEYIKDGNVWVLETDIASFFESLDHELLLKRLSAKVDDQRIINLVFSYLTAPLFHEMSFSSVEGGVSIGGIISPLLSNIYLHPLDQEMTHGNYNYVRYSDDLVVLGIEKEEIRRALFLVKTILKKIKLNLNKEKTLMRHISEGFNFLGFRFDQKGKGPALKAMEALHQNIAVIIGKRNKPKVTLEQLVEFLQGWQNYFGILAWMIPDNLTTLVALARLAVIKGDADWSEKLLKVRSKVAGGNADLCYLLALEWNKLGWAEETLSELGRALLYTRCHKESMDMLIQLLKVEKEQLDLIVNQLIFIAERPQYAGSYYALSEIYLQCGLFILAQSAHSRGAALESISSMGAPEGMITSASLVSLQEKITLAEKDMEQFLQLFIGRDDLYAFEVPSDNGERYFTTVKGTLTPEQVARHLNGEITLATYLIRENHTVRLMVIDIDVSKKLILENENQSDKVEALIRLAQTDANRIKSVSANMGITTYLEDSGRRGRHCWFFFEKPVSAKYARFLAGTIMRKAGEPSGGITWELFPNADKWRNAQSSQRIKLPLGLHPKSGKRGLFVDEFGTPFPEQGEYLHSIKCIPTGQLDRIIVVEEKREGAILPKLKAEQTLFNKDSVLIMEAPVSLVKPVVTKCTLVKYLVLKAEQTSYLTHADRLALLHVLAHLGDMGKAYLHQVMACCLNYNHNITQKHIDRLPAKPISCNRLRERYQQLSTMLNCNCRFTRLPNTYPSPILHAVKKNSAKPEGLNLPLLEDVLSETIGDDIDTIEAIIKKMQNLHNQQQGIEKKLKKYEQVLSRIFNEKQIERLPVKAGTLMRIRKENGEIGWVIEI